MFDARRGSLREPSLPSQQSSDGIGDHARIWSDAKLDEARGHLFEIRGRCVGVVHGGLDIEHPIGADAGHEVRLHQERGFPFLLGDGHQLVNGCGGLLEIRSPELQRRQPSEGGEASAGILGVLEALQCFGHCPLGICSETADDQPRSSEGGTQGEFIVLSFPAVRQLGDRVQ